MLSSNVQEVKPKKDRKMKRKQLFLMGILLMAVAMLSTSCVNMKVGLSGDIATEYRPLKDFEKIEISGSPNVYYTQADTFSVKVRGPKDAMENILTEVDGGTLSIRNRGGSGDFTSEKRIDTDQMEVVLRGSGDMTVRDLICDACHVELVGSGDINIDRLETKESDVTLVGSGDIAINQWRVLSTRLGLKGSGDIKVNFNEGCQAVDSELRGSGDITLRGVVSRFSQQKTGSGDIDIDHLQIVK